MYTLYYTSADGPGPDATWSVYSEQYEAIDSPEPIEGSTQLVAAGLINEAIAEHVARVRQRAAFVSRNRESQP